MAAGTGHAAQAYFNAGGLGILVGDGKLPHYGIENVVEFYYNFEVHKGVNVTFDYQLTANPASMRIAGRLVFWLHGLM